MNLENVRDWPRIQQRYEAWWEGEMLDRPILQIHAPGRTSRRESDDNPSGPEDMVDWVSNPQRVFPRLLRGVKRTYYAGDAFPMVFPLTAGIPAIQAAYMGSRVTPTFDSLSFWTDPTILDWDHMPNLEVDPDNWWWQKTLSLLELGAHQGVGLYYVSPPDIQGGGQILAQLRGTEPLLVDLVDRPEFIVDTIHKINQNWLYYYQTCFEVIHRYSEGYCDWLGCYSSKLYATTECDFSAMISPAMFKRYFLPGLEEQVDMVERSVYHFDGPGQIPHLKYFLGIKNLDGIQWVQGAGATVMTDWIPMLQQIQAAGKKLTLNCAAWEVKRLVTELKPEGLLLTTGCGSAEEADALVREVDAMFGVKE